MTDPLPSRADPHLPECRQCAGAGHLVVSQRVGESDFHEFEAHCAVCDGAGVAPESVQKHVEQLRSELDQARAELMQIGIKKMIDGTRPPVAHVPIHPRNGPLWANTVENLDVGDRPHHYPTRPLAFAD